MGARVTVEIFYHEGCKNMPLAFGRVGEALQGFEARATVKVLLMRDRDKLGGSPTILVAGRDVYPTAHTAPPERLNLLGKT